VVEAGWRLDSILEGRLFASGGLAWRGCLSSTASPVFPGDPFSVGDSSLSFEFTSANEPEGVTSCLRIKSSLFRAGPSSWRMERASAADTSASRSSKGADGEGCFGAVVSTSSSLSPPGFESTYFVSMELVRDLVSS